MWLVFSREHCEDPLLSEIGGGWGGVRNAYIFFDRSGVEPEKIFIGSHELRDPIISESYDRMIYCRYSKEGVLPHLKDIVIDRNPRKIGINVSPTLPMADGLTWTLRNFLEDVLGPKYSSRLTSAELLIRDFRTKHIPEELAVYRDLCRWTIVWEEEALSEAVAKVGETTANDIHWWMRQKALDLGFDVEFLPGVRITRKGKNLTTNLSNISILPGDVLSIDAGLKYIDYCTDYKRTAYVLKSDENKPPISMEKAFNNALEVYNLLVKNFKPGAIAHEIWENTMDKLQKQGYNLDLPETGSQSKSQDTPAVGIYAHSVGNSSHDIGARVAINWPFAYGDRVQYPIVVNAWYSVELHVNIPIPEWDGRVVPIRIEESIVVTEKGFEHFVPPQKKLLVIKSENGF